MRRWRPGLAVPARHEKARRVNELAGLLPRRGHEFDEDSFDAVLLATVCSFCHQAAGLLQSMTERAIRARGGST